MDSYAAMLQCVKDIYNKRILKVPESNKMHDKILTLSTKRDILKQNVDLLWDQQLSSVISQFAEMEITKILKNDALARLGRREARLQELKNLYSLAGEHGHVYVVLLYMLMEMQYRKLHEIAQFIADARHYFTTEYKLSSIRCEVMQQQQDEYTTTLMGSPKTCNIFNQLFINMILGNCLDKSPLSSALKRYDDLLNDNIKTKLMLETLLNDKIDKLQKLTNEVNKNYMDEIKNEPTNNLKPISFEIETTYKEVSASIKELQVDVTKIRNQLKERIKTEVEVKFEREKDILWQRFLADPDTLRRKYEEGRQIANNCHFGDTTENKQNS